MRLLYARLRLHFWLRKQRGVRPETPVDIDGLSPEASPGAQIDGERAAECRTRGR